MTAEKRQIPINHSRAAGPAGEPPAGGRAQATPGDAAAAGASATTGATPAGGGRGHSGASHGGGHHGAAAKAAGAAELQALQGEAERPGADLETLTGDRDALTKERDDLKDQLLRLRAEFDNFRRRATREALDAGNRAQCDLLSEVLPVLDNLERALDAAEHHEEGKVLRGVRMTRDMFVNLLSRSGVEEIEGVGARFDPQFHDAMLVQPSEQEEGAVSAVLEKGYRQGDRVLRPARVVVSAGPGGPGATTGVVTGGSAAGGLGGGAA